MSFAGVRPVLHTPVEPGGDQPIAHEALGALAERMIGHGVDGVVVLGLASEAWALTEGERDAVCETVVHTVEGRVPIVVGIEGASRIAAERAGRASALGANGLMVLPPPNAESPESLIDHFGEVADAAGLPVLIQDSPQVSGREMSVEVLLGLQEAHPLLRSVKVEGADAGRKITRLVDAGMEVVAGWGGLQYLEMVRRGAGGCMPGCDLALTILRVDRLARAGSAEEAERLYASMLPLLSYEAQSLSLLILGAKRALQRAGVFPSGAMRKPARDLDPYEAETFDRLFERLHCEQVPGW